MRVTVRRNPLDELSPENSAGQFFFQALSKQKLNDAALNTQYGDR
jgi:hypothetical protein